MRDLGNGKSTLGTLSDPTYGESEVVDGDKSEDRRSGESRRKWDDAQVLKTNLALRIPSSQSPSTVIGVWTFNPSISSGNRFCSNLCLNEQKKIDECEDEKGEGQRMEM